MGVDLRSNAIGNTTGLNCELLCFEATGAGLVFSHCAGLVLSYHYAFFQQSWDLNVTQNEKNGWCPRTPAVLFYFCDLFFASSSSQLRVTDPALRFVQAILQSIDFLISIRMLELHYIRNQKLLHSHCCIRRCIASHGVGLADVR